MKNFITLPFNYFTYEWIKQMSEPKTAGFSVLNLEFGQLEVINQFIWKTV